MATLVVPRTVFVVGVTVTSFSVLRSLVILNTQKGTPSVPCAGRVTATATLPRYSTRLVQSVSRIVSVAVVPVTARPRMPDCDHVGRPATPPAGVLVSVHGTPFGLVGPPRRTAEDPLKVIRSPRVVIGSPNPEGQGW